MACCWNGLCGLIARRRPQPYMIHSRETSAWILVNSMRSQATEKYNVSTEILGEGGFGNVRMVADKHTHRKFIMKTMLKEGIPDVKMFQNEVSCQSACDHPNIARLRETFEDKKMVYVIMEFCEGGEILDIIEQQGYMGELDSWHVFHQLADALAYLHCKVRIVHRDLKPENFLIKEKDLPLSEATVKLIDFGFARRFTPGKKTLEEVCGTPDYMCPEMFDGPYDEKCDIWSSGVILHLLLCGELPFEGETIQEIVGNVKEGKLSFSQPVWALVDASAKQLVQELCCKEPSQRPRATDLRGKPWMKKRRAQLANTQAAEHTSFNIASNLKSFTKKNRFQKMALDTISHHVPDKDIRTLRETFQQLDTEGKGTINVQMLKNVCTEKGIPEQEIIAICKDLGQDGEVSYSNWLSANIKRQQYLQETYCWEAFRVFDRNGNGEIELEEFKLMLKEHGSRELRMTEEQADELFLKFDTSGNKTVDFDEFLAMLRAEV